MPLGRGLASLIPPPEDRENEAQQYREEETTPDITPREEQSLSTEAPPVIEPQADVSAPSVYIHAKPEEKVEGAVFQIEVDKIFPNPHQPRKYFDEDALRELALSIREFGILQPLVISKVESESETGWTVRYELVTGERRLMAAKIAGLHTVPAIIRREPDDIEKLEIAVIENIQREDLNPIEFARAIARLQDEFGLTQREIAVRIGKSRETIANAVRLLGLPTEIQEAIGKNQISESQGRLLLTIDDPVQQTALFHDLLNNNLTVRELRRRIHGIRQTDQRPIIDNQQQKIVDPEIVDFQEQLTDLFCAPVKIVLRQAQDKKEGEVVISFYSPEEIRGIIDKL